MFNSKIALCSLSVLLALAIAPAQAEERASAPPPSTESFPLSEVHRGLMAEGWTVFEGNKPEPFEVEILGVLRSALGPGQDLILAKLHGAKPEFTGVVAGMSGSPVYVGNRLLGALSYRIGDFAKEPIAGITPIAQMLETRTGEDAAPKTADGAAPMATPLLMSGYSAEAIDLWKEKMKGTGLDAVAALSGAGSADTAMKSGPLPLPGEAVSLELVRGDLEMAATCTVSYVDLKQLLACGHPIARLGRISAPMTRAEVVTTLASSYNSFKIVNTGETIGSFTADRNSAIRGEFAAAAHMIPIEIKVSGTRPHDWHIEVIDSPQLTVQAALVSIYQCVLANNQVGSETSYHVRGGIRLAGYGDVPLESWAVNQEMLPANILAALAVGERLNRIYNNPTRTGAIEGIRVEIEPVDGRRVEHLESARLSSLTARAGETGSVELTLRPWQGETHNVRLRFALPASLPAGNVRLVVADGATLDRLLSAGRQAAGGNLNATVNDLRSLHPNDRFYVALLTPQAEAGQQGQVLAQLPLSVASALESQRASGDTTLNGESALPVAETKVDGMASGFITLSFRIE